MDAIFTLQPVGSASLMLKLAFYSRPLSPFLSGCHLCTLFCDTSISKRGVFIDVWCPSFCSCSPGDTLDLLALEARGACISGSHRTITISETVFGRLLPPGPCTESRLKNTRAVSVKETHLLGLEQLPKGQASGLTHI